MPTISYGSLSMNLYEIYEELEHVVQQEVPLAAFQATSPLLHEPRYSQALGSPVDLLVADIAAAAERLPDPSRGHSKWMLRIDQKAPPGWSDRLGREGFTGNRGGRKEYVLRLMAFVAYELLRIWQTDAVRSATDPLERLAYEQRLEIDDNDHRQNTLHRTISARVSAGAQRFAILPYYYGIGPVPPGNVVALSPGQKYVGSVPAPLGENTRWWSHVIHLGRPYVMGEPVKIRTCETYFDKDRRLYDESPDYGVHLLINVISPAMERIHLAIRLPRSLRADAKPEWRIAAPPLKVPHDRGELELRDGWAERSFKGDLRLHNEYGLFFPGTRLY
jgi:hypothetical protein